MKSYILDEQNKPVLTDDVAAWQWIHDHPHRKIVGRTQFPDGTSVSTVFLSLDHNWEDGPPILWETMVFGSPAGSQYENEWQDRYISYSDAVEGHISVVKDILCGVK